MKYVFITILLLALPVIAIDYGTGYYGNDTYEGVEEETPAPSPSSSGGGGGGSGFGNFSPPRRNVTQPAQNNSPPVQVPAAPSLPEQVDEILEDIFKDVPWIIFEINTTKLINGINGWADDTYTNTHRFISETDFLATASMYAMQATDLPNYSYRAKLLLIFTIISLVFIMIKPRGGGEHPAHKVMKHIMFGHKAKHEKKEEKKEQQPKEKKPLHHRIKHHAIALGQHIKKVVPQKKPVIDRKFVGKIRFADGKTEYCYESEGKAVVCHGHLPQLASEIKKKFGKDFKNKLTYQAPNKKLNGAKFVELASIEQHNLEKLINEKKPAIHHKVVHHTKQVVHKVHHTAKKAVQHVAKHVKKPKPRPKKDKYMDFYKKVRKAKSLKEISEV